MVEHAQVLHRRIMGIVRVCKYIKGIMGTVRVYKCMKGIVYYAFFLFFYTLFFIVIVY